MSTLDSVRRAWQILSPEERRDSALLIGALGIAAIAELASVAVIYPFLAVIAEPSLLSTDPRLAALHGLAGRPDQRTFLLQLGAAVLAVTIGANALIAGTTWWQVRSVWRVNHTISRRLIARHLSRPYGDFLATNTSIFAKQVLDESQTLVVSTLDPLFTLTGRLASATLIAGLLVAVAPVVTLAFFGLVAVVYALLYVPMRGRLKASGEAALAANQARFRAVGETLGAIKQIKVAGLETLFLQRYERHSRAYSGHQATHNIARRIPYHAMQTVAFGGLTLLLISLVASGHDLAYILPVVGVIAVGGFRLLPAFQQILAAAVALRFTGPIIAALHTELRQPVSEVGGGKPGILAPADEIALDRVTFTHPGARQPTLDQVTVRIPAHSSAAFVGSTGAGKSTLLDVLLGLLVPSEGAIRIDGKALSVDDLPAWHRAVGYVPQGVFLTDDTIAANIAFGEPTDRTDLDRLEHAARIAQIHDFVVSLPDGYLTRVGERGVRLSGGQRQRIGIARALYHDPPVLVLDEATSDIDNRTEAEIVRAIETHASAKTVVMVAHRLQAARNCDVIHVMDSGRVVASGTYDELIARDARFRELALVQESNR